MNLFLGIITNKIFISAIAGYLLASLIKYIITIEQHHPNLHEFLMAGGMPSAHSATVSALSTALYLQEGFTDLFVITLIFSIIIVVDTMLRPKETRHSWKQVVVGILLGVVVGVLIKRI